MLNVLDPSYKSEIRNKSIQKSEIAQYKDKIMSTTKTKLQQKTMKHLFPRGDDEIVHSLFISPLHHEWTVLGVVATTSLICLVRLYAYISLHLRAFGEVLGVRQIQVLLLKFSVFFFNIFDPQLIECVDAEPADTRSNGNSSFMPEKKIK